MKKSQKAHRPVKPHRLEIPQADRAPSDGSSAGDESDLHHREHGAPREAKPLPSSPPRAPLDRWSHAVHLLIDELRFLKRPGEVGRAAREGDKIDREEYQKAEVDAFFAFEKRLASLDQKLVAFHNAVRHLGSSVGIVMSAQNLRHCFEDVRLTLRWKSIVAFPALEIDIHKRQKRRAIIMSRPTVQKDITRCLQSLAKSLERLLSRINEIAEFEEEGINTCVDEFLVDLRFWADYLLEFPDETPSKEVSIYIHDLAEPIGNHAVAFTEVLASFIEHGVPTIRFGQSQAGVAYQNLSTVSTLLCAVTATTIQFVYTNATTPLQQGVIILWILSLMFSVASAINAQLAYHWTVTRVRSPRERIPWLMRMIITRVPIHFLIGSVIAFSAGLVCFSYSAFPHTVIPAITTTGTAVTLTALLLVLFWLAAERWVLYWSKGEEWLTVYAEAAAERTFAWLARRRQMYTPGPNTGPGNIPITPTIALPVPTSNGTPHRPKRPSIAVTPVTDGYATAPVSPVDVPLDGATSLPLPPPLATPSTAKDTLVRLEYVGIVHEDTAPVRHLAFSPDGNHLASCGGDKQVLLWKDEQGTLKMYRALQHDPGIVHYICWSPNGSRLLGRTRDTIIVWDMEGHPHRPPTVISRAVSSVRWMPDGQSIVASEGPDVVVLLLDGSVKHRSMILPHGGTSPFPRITDLAVTPDGSRLVLSATKKITANGNPSSRVNVGRQLIVYNLNDRRVDHVVPILHQVRGVTLSSHGNKVLVTYEKKTPEVLNWTSVTSTGAHRLDFSHPCSHRQGVKTVGLSSIGAVWGNSQEDQLVFCATKDRLCWWDGKSGRFLSATTPVSPEISEFTSAAWNHGASTVNNLWVVAGLMSGGLALYKSKPADDKVQRDGSSLSLEPDGSPT